MRVYGNRKKQSIKSTKIAESRSEVPNTVAASQIWILSTSNAASLI